MKKLIFNPEWKQSLIKRYEKLSETTKLIILQDKAIKNDGSNIYIRNKMNFAKDLPNTKVELYKVDSTNDEELELLQKVLWRECSASKRSKLMLQKPCSPKLEKVFKTMINIFEKADVEGVSDKNELILLQDDKQLSPFDDLIIPCTALGNLILLNEVTKGDNSFYDGKTVLIIGRSEIVGKPLAQIFAKENCTTILANSYTNNLQELCQMSDIIISCVGKPDLVKHCKQGAILIDNGCTLVNGKQHGDIDKSLYSMSKAYTPYINATGKTTVFSLFVNLLKLSK